MPVGKHHFQLTTNKPAIEPTPYHANGNRIFNLVSQQGSALTSVEKAMRFAVFVKFGVAR
jgi:hypothetical protein